MRFLESLEFTSTNDRLFINVLKDLGFLDTDSVPKDRYYQFLDRAESTKVVAEGIREAYSDLFAVNIKAHELSSDEARNKLRTLYKGAKKDNLLGRIASTFTALCEYADFSGAAKASLQKDKSPEANKTDMEKSVTKDQSVEQEGAMGKKTSSLSLDSLQYHINIVLPDTRDQAVYDAIFKSLRDHLGAK